VREPQGEPDDRHRADGTERNERTRFTDSNHIA
jgi:hypothetical protein